MSTPTPVTVIRTVTATITGTTPSSTLRAKPQAGVLEGGNPTVYDPSNPLTLFIIQAGIIIIFCRLLHYPLSKLRQPRVIAEVIGGILLGPSVMGRIPGFSNAIFPTASMPVITMAANLGLVLFLFLVGLEVDLRYLASNGRVALAVGAGGMALPFGLGVAIAYGLYNTFSSEPGTVPVSFGVYLLFIGVAMAITAFPVLCRILTELKLLNTPVGVIVLSAGVGNDVVGWILLALCVALVNAGSGITALWVLLIAVGYTLFLVYAVRPAFIWLLKRTGSFQNGPTQGVMVVTLLMILISAFITSIIGIHPIFGSFVVGVIMPHDGGFAVKVTEKIEDLVSALLLPLYFALSGLSTNLGLLDSGITWAYVVGVIAVAFFGKMTGGTLAARLCGLVWRESFAVGSLMSCKGLVELIVLNIGLQAKILSVRTFTIFVVMALVTTVITTPLVSALYPHWYQVKLAAWKRGEIDWDGNPLEVADTDTATRVGEKRDRTRVSKILAYLRLDSMSGVMALVSLFAEPAREGEHTREHPSKTTATEPAADASTKPESRPLQVYGMRLTELTERESSVMRVSELDEYSARDPVVNAFKTFGQVKNVAISGQLAVVSESSYANLLAERATEAAADLLLIPWSNAGSMREAITAAPAGDSDTNAVRFADGAFSRFVADATARANCPVAVFVDNGFGHRRRDAPTGLGLSRTVSALSQRSLTAPAAPVGKGHHVFLPYFGSEDDRLALRLVLQMALDPSVTVTVVHFEAAHAGPSGRPEEVAEEEAEQPKGSGARALAGRVLGAAGARRSQRVQHEVSDYAAFFAQLRDSLPATLEPRVLFETTACSSPVADAVARAKTEVGLSPKGAGDLVVLGRNQQLAGALAGGSEAWASSEAGKVLGAVAGGVVREVKQASVLVVSAGDM